MIKYKNKKDGKKMKKIIKIAVGVIVIMIVGFFAITKLSEGFQQPAEQNGISGIFDEGNDDSEDFVQTTRGLSYNGKVLPAKTYYYSRNTMLEFNRVYVEAGDIVAEGDILFDYEGNAQNGLQSEVLEKNFVQYQEKLNDYYTRLDNLKTDLAGADPTDTVYINYLRVEINSVEQMIAQTKLEWSKNETQIDGLRDSNSDLIIRADMAGLVYQVNDPKEASGLSSGAYIVLYSSEKKVRLNVSEYEYGYFSEGQEVELFVEALQESYTAKITHVDSVPNNLLTSAYSDTSFYYVEIAIPSEVPYGFSVIVTVPINE